MVSGMDAMFSCISNLYDVRIRIAITCIVPSGYLRGPLLKRSRFLGVVLSGGKSVKEELNCIFPHSCNNPYSAEIFNPFTTIHDGNFRRHSSMYVTIHLHDGNFRRIYYSYTRIPGSWHAPRPRG